MGIVFIIVVALQVKTHLAVYSSGGLCLDYGGTLITFKIFNISLSQNGWGCKGALEMIWSDPQFH